MGKSIADTKCMKDFSNYNIPELMEVSSDELQELSFEEFGKEVMGFYLNGKYQKQFDEKMELAKNAVKEGIVINVKNQYYKEINLYTWIRHTINKKYKNNELSNEDIFVVERLIGKPLYRLFNYKGNYIKVIDIKNREVILYKSQQETIRDIRARFDMKITHPNIFNRLNGTCKSPYKGRFMFYYATDEEVKKYMEDNKVS